MGELIYGIDFKNKKRLTPDLAIAEVGALLTLEQQATGLSLDSSPETLLYASGYGFADPDRYHSPDKDPA